jgi:glycosidase
MHKSLLTLVICGFFAVSLQAQKSKKDKSNSKKPQSEVVVAAKSPVVQKSKAAVGINDPSLGLNNMVTLQPGKTWVWLGDFYPYVTSIDSVTVPQDYPGAGIANLRFSWNRESKADSMQLWWEGDGYGKESALQYFQIWSGGVSTTVPVRKSEKVLREFRWKTKQYAYASVKVKGTFNAWNANNLSLRWEEDPTDKTQGTWVGSTWVGPGSHQYVFVVSYAGKWNLETKEIRDPNNKDSLGNGMGGFNSTFMVSTADLQLNTSYTSPQPIDYWNAEIASVIGLSTKNMVGLGKGEYNSVLAMWQNQRLPVELGEYNPMTGLSMIKIQVPKSAWQAHRSYVRVWIGSYEGVSNEVLVPLASGRVIYDMAKFGDRKDPRTMVMYNPMIDRFVDGKKENNKPLNRPEVDPKVDFYGGDVVGITKKIEEGFFTELGVNAIWISPVVRNPEGPYGQWTKTPATKFSGYHGYWPVALRATDPRFCTEAELKQLIETAHKYHINIFLDYVAHHIHQEHPLYKQYPSWFTPLYLPDGSKNTERWDDYRLTTWFDDFMPTFNYFKPEVVDALTDSALWWFKNFDVDGFRHDATKHIPDPFWRALTYKIKTQVSIPQHRPYYQIGETYGSPELISSYLGSGMLDAQFDFNMYDAAVNTFKGNGGCKQLAQTLNDSKKWYGAHHTMGNVSGNQDKARIISILDGSMKEGEDSKQAGWDRNIQVRDTQAYDRLLGMMAYNFAIPGIPVIYYGDEIGMPGASDPDSRRMMRFDRGLGSTQSNGAVNGLSLREKQQRTIVAHMAKFRSTHMSMTYGDMKVTAPSDDVLIVQRKYFGEIVYAVFNRSNTTKTIELSFSEGTYPIDLKTGKTYTGIVGGIRTFNDSKLIQDDMGTVWVVIPPGKFEYVYN